MNKFTMTAVLAIALSVFAAWADEEPIWEPIEWTDIWVPDTNKDDLPHALLVGDSIVRGYYDEVENELEGKAYTARYSTSKFIGHQAFVEELEILLNSYDFDVIHINNGLHGWDYTEVQYEESFLKLLDLLSKSAGGAKVIWAMTTPVRDNEDLTQFADRNKRVKARNKIAGAIMKEHGIPVNDLYSAHEGQSAHYATDGVHFNGEGQAAQGRLVAGTISKYLPEN